jgi:hypothetical protein
MTFLLTRGKKLKYYKQIILVAELLILIIYCLVKKKYVMSLTGALSLGVEVLQELGVEVSHDFEIWYRGLDLDSK